MVGRVQRQVEAAVGVQVRELRVPPRQEQPGALGRGDVAEEHRPGAGDGYLAAARDDAGQCGGHPVPQFFLDLRRADLGVLQVRNLRPGLGPVALTRGECRERHGGAFFA